MVIDRLPRLSGIWFLSCAFLIGAAHLQAQVRMEGSGPGGMVRLFNSDSAVLEAGEVREDLPCSVTPIKPFLGFNLKFHSGYDVTVPMKALVGTGNLLTMVFRVTPDNHKEEPVYFYQKVNVPAIDENAHGDAYLQGAYDLGEGRYHVDWLMRDRGGRVCSNFWDVDAGLDDRDKDIALHIPPATVQEASRHPFRQEPPVERDRRDGPLDVKVMVNFAPQNSLAATLQPLDMNALVSILRSIAREPRIGKFSIVAFNAEEQRVIYRQEDASQIDFPALGKAIESLNLGTVNLKMLSQKNGESEFLASLFTKELSEGRPDAVIIASPKVSLNDKLPEDMLKQIGQVDYPVFYMNYILDPQANPWRDAIGNAVKYFKGAEFTISRPRDLFNAWSEIVARIVKSKTGRQVANASSQ